MGKRLHSSTKRRHATSTVSLTQDLGGTPVLRPAIGSWHGARTPRGPRRIYRGAEARERCGQRRCPARGGTAMLGFPIAQHQTEGILSFLALLLAVTLLGNLAGGGDTTFPSGNDWQHFVSIGDALAREGGMTDVNGGWPTVRQRFAARTAYLLAFHEAQDARDVPRMLIADDRLARVGEPDLAA